MMRLRDRRGFTLVELMMVVVVLAVLAAVAMFSYNKYMRKAKTQEAVGVLGDIKMKQAQFMASYGRYVSTGSGGPFDSSGYWPVDGLAASDPGGSTPWNGANGGSSCTNSDPASAFGAFCLLGVHPPGEVYFQYKTVGWRADDPTLSGTPPEAAIPNATLAQRGVDKWWYASARTVWSNNSRHPVDWVYVLDSIILTQPITKEEGAASFPN